MTGKGNDESAARGRRLVLGDGIVVAPGAYDVLSAMLIERAGFGCIYMTGNGQAASAIGLPDLGLITLSEMSERIRATVARTTVPVIADADNGYGGLIALQRGVREFERAGASAIQIEDQASPKRCGHEPGRELVSVADMVARMRAACDARTSADTLIIARTDARYEFGLDEAIRRGQAYADAGADVIFVESPETEDELREITRRIDAHTLINIVETGRTPYLPWQRLEELGFDLAIYPASPFLAACGAVEAVLGNIREHGSAEPSLPRMMTLHEYHSVLHFDEIAAAEARYHAEALDVVLPTAGA